VLVHAALLAVSVSQGKQFQQKWQPVLRMEWRKSQTDEQWRLSVETVGIPEIGQKWKIAKIIGSV